MLKPNLVVTNFLFAIAGLMTLASGASPAQAESFTLRRDSDNRSFTCTDNGVASLPAAPPQTVTSCKCKRRNGVSFGTVYAGIGEMGMLASTCSGLDQDALLSDCQAIPAPAGMIACECKRSNGINYGQVVAAAENASALLTACHRKADNAMLENCVAK